MGKRILMTGASGYLGSTLLYYIPNDWEIIALGRTQPKIKIPQNVTFINADITSEPPNLKLFGDIDIVLHLAAIKGSKQCEEKSKETEEVNVVGTRNILNAAINSNVKRFIFASTYWVYGDNNIPFIEEMSLNPVEIYGKTKAISEKEITSSGINYNILRFTNIFGLGSGIRPKEVIFNFIKLAFEGKPIVLHCGGKQKLDFIEIKDVCTCLIKIMEADNFPNGIFNIGRGRPTSIATIAQIIRRIFQKNYKQDLEIISTESCKEPDKYVSISKLEKETGVMDLKPLELSIESYIKSYSERLS